jgi:hypothetical protein
MAVLRNLGWSDHVATKSTIMEFFSGNICEERVDFIHIMFLLTAKQKQCKHLNLYLAYVR